MNISDILKHKGANVMTTSPDQTVADVAATLTEYKIGALVVLDGDSVAGIVAERDVVRALAVHGADALATPVAEMMTAPVTTCTSSNSVDAVGRAMTELRARHMPVVDDGRLAGLVSIGDVVSSRMRQLEKDRGQLEQYISG